MTSASSLTSRPIPPSPFYTNDYSPVSLANLQGAIDSPVWTSPSYSLFPCLNNFIFFQLDCVFPIPAHRSPFTSSFSCCGQSDFSHCHSIPALLCHSIPSDLRCDVVEATRDTRTCHISWLVRPVKSISFRLMSIYIFDLWRGDKKSWNEGRGAVFLIFCQTLEPSTPRLSSAILLS